MSYKIFLCDDIVSFITNHSNVIETNTKSTDKSSKIYFIDNCFKATEDPNIFEIIGKIDLIEYYCKNHETENNIT